jgi:hypothetical protein
MPTFNFIPLLSHPAPAELNAPRILQENIGGKWYHGSEEGGLEECLEWLDGQKDGIGAYVKPDGQRGGQSFMMDGSAAANKLQGRSFTIKLEGDIPELPPQTLGGVQVTAGNDEEAAYTRVKGAAGKLLTITITSSEDGVRRTLGLGSFGNLFNLAPSAYLDVRFENLHLKGIAHSVNTNMPDGWDLDRDSSDVLSQGNSDGTTWYSLLYVGAGNKATLRNAWLSGNYGVEDLPANGLSGGGIAVAATGSITLDAGSRVEYNTAGNASLLYGGGIAADGAVFLRTGSAVDHNLAKGGGGIALYGTDASLDMEDSYIRYNKAGDLGGGGLNTGESCTVTISRSEISDNQTDGSGGGVYAQHSDKLSLIGSIITGNVASKRGGGMYLYNNSTTAFRLSMSGGEISANTAGLGSAATGTPGGGGGVYLYGWGNFEMSEGAVIKGNVAACDFADGLNNGDGGALRMEEINGSIQLKLETGARIYGNPHYANGSPNQPTTRADSNIRHPPTGNNRDSLPGDTCNVGAAAAILATSTCEINGKLVTSGTLTPVFHQISWSGETGGGGNTRYYTNEAITAP